MVDVTEVTTQTAFEQAVCSPGGTLIFFTQQPGYCPYCDKLKPIIEEFAEKSPSGRVLSADISRYRGINAKYQGNNYIFTQDRGTPTLVLAFDGNVYTETAGYWSNIPDDEMANELMRWANEANTRYRTNPNS